MLQRLELKLPPGVLILIFAALIGWLDWLNSVPDLPLPLPVWLRISSAAILLLAAAVLLLISTWQFLKQKTTLDPRIPEQSSSLVTTGLYRFSRNPIYVGFAGLLLSEALFLNSFIGVVLVLLFVSYLQRWQIIPEERFLRAQFGDDYEQYCALVRRWL